VREAALELASRKNELDRFRAQDSIQPYMLPAAIDEPLCSPEQREWWTAVYQVTTNTARFDGEITSHSVYNEMAFGLWTFGTFSICILVYILLIAYCSIQPLAAILNKPIIIIIIISKHVVINIEQIELICA